MRGVPAVVVALFVLVVLCGVGGGLVWWVAQRRGFARDVQGFASVQGRVVEWEIVETRTGRRARSIRHIPRIRYAFEVSGQGFESEVISPAPPRFVERSEAEAWAAASGLAAGAGIEVFYDAADPRRSVLMREVGADFEREMHSAEIGGWVVLGIAGVGALVAGVVGVLRASRRVAR